MIGCNQNCNHCYAGGGRRQYLRSLDELMRIYSTFSTAARGKVIIDLGYLIHEITLHPELTDIIKWLKSIDDSGKLNHNLVTNGSGLVARSGLLEELIRLGITSLQLTLYGIGDVHDNFAGRRGAYQDIINVSRAGKEMGLIIIWNIHLHRGMKSQINDLIELAEDTGLNRSDVNWTISAPIGLARGIQDRRLRLDDLTDYPDIITDLKRMRILPESEIVSSIMSEQHDEAATSEERSVLPEPLFVVMADGKVHLFFEGYDDYSCLGALDVDTAEGIISKYENDDTPCQRVEKNISVKELAGKYRDPKGELLYYRTNLIGFWRRLYWEQHYK